MQYFIISFSYCLLFIYNFVVVVIVLNKIQLALLAKPLVAWPALPPKMTNRNEKNPRWPPQRAGQEQTAAGGNGGHLTWHTEHVNI